MSRNFRLGFAAGAVAIVVAASCGTDSPVSPAEFALAGSGLTDCEVAEPTEADHDDLGADHDEPEADHDEPEADHDGTTLGAEDVEMVIEIDMNEFAYNCRLPSIPTDTVVALRFTNTGSVVHEAVVGDQDAQDDAEAAMLTSSDDDGGAHGHNVPSITVQPGDTGDLIVRFDDPGALIVGCHISGHWDAGMHTDFLVAEA